MMEINIEKLLESGMSPESIGKMVQLEAQKKQEKNREADVARLEAARFKVLESYWEYMNIIDPYEGSDADKEAFFQEMRAMLLENEEVIANILTQQKFQQSTSRCSCKEQTSEPQKNVKNDKWKSMPGYKERTPRVKVNVEELDEAAIDKLIRDFARTLV